MVAAIWYILIWMVPIALVGEISIREPDLDALINIVLTPIKPDHH